SDQLADQGDDLGQRLGGTRLDVGPPQAQFVRVGDVGVGHLAGQVVGMDAPLPGRLVDLVVDVGDVLDQLHRLPAPLEVALHQLEDDVGPGVANVDAVVHGRAADVHADTAVVARLELDELA